MIDTKTLVLAAVGVFAVGFASERAAAETITLRIGAGHPAAATWITTIREGFMPQVAERVKKETKHEIRWAEAWGGSVCKLGECLEAVESGLLDMGELQTPFEPAKLMAQNFSFFAPFGTPDPRVGVKLIRQTYDEVPALKKSLEDRYKQVFIGVGILGNYGLVTSFTWDKIEQLANQKVAAAGPNIPWVQAVGIVPVQSNLNEAYTSMQTGVYNGWVMFPDGVTSFKLEEVSKQFTITGFGVIATPLLTMNKDKWDSLPKDVQAIILEEGKNWSTRAGEFTAGKQEAAFATMKAKGVRVVELSAADQKLWASKLPNIPKERTAEIARSGMPAAGVYHYIELLKKAGHAFPRDWTAER